MSDDLGPLTHDECLKEANSVKQVLGAMLTEGPRTRGTVCVAGSASLHWHLLNYPKDGFAKRCLFQPGDVDIFVCGSDGQTQDAFKAAVYGMIDQLKDKGYLVGRITVKKNLYILRDVPVLIINMSVAGCQGSRMSFIQCPRDSTPEDVVARFDINIVQVIYDIATGEFCMEDDVRKSIEVRKAEIKKIRCQFTAPNEDEVRKIICTLERVAKYRRRGFSFGTCIQLKRNTTDANFFLPATSYQEHKSMRKSFAATQVVDEVIEFLSEMFPKTVLQRGLVGLFGELPLTKLINDEQCSVSQSIVAPWKVDTANVCVCSTEAASTVSFRKAFKQLRSKMRMSSMYNFTFRERRIRFDGIVSRMDVVEFNIREVGPRICFIWCPWARSVATFAQQSLIGGERVWYNFEEERCEFGHGVEEQLRTGTIQVDDMVLRTCNLRLKDIAAYSTLLKRMWYFHSQGFTFQQYPAIIMPSCFCHQFQ